MNQFSADSCPLIVLFSHDQRLAQTRHWVLEQAGFRMHTVHSLVAMIAVAEQGNVAVFLLCNSLSAELRSEAAQLIRERWKHAKMLIFVPPQPMPELPPADDFFYPMEGTGRMVQMVRHLLPLS